MAKEWSQVWIDLLGATGQLGLKGFSQCVPGPLPKGLELCQAPYQKGWTLLLPGSLTRGLGLLGAIHATPLLLLLTPSLSRFPSTS